MRKKKRGYANYNYEDIYDYEVLGEETIEEKIEELRKSQKKCKWVLRTWICGDYLETEIFPKYRHNYDIPRSPHPINESKDKQMKLNRRNSERQMIRIMNANFGKGDLSLDLTYDDGHLPDEGEARKDIQNYLSRIKRYRKKNNLSELKYVYRIEYFSEDAKGNTKKTRVHFHMVISGMDRDVAEDLWGKGRVNADRLQPDENGIIGKAKYIIKDHKKKHKSKRQIEEQIRFEFEEMETEQPEEEECRKKGEHRWSASKNLIRPKPRDAITKLSRREAERLARDQNLWKETFERIYKEKYIFNQGQLYVSDITGGFYLHCRMRRRD